MRTIQVSNCFNCPFGWADDSGHSVCSHPDVEYADGGSFTASLTAPSFCPLRNEEVILKLEESK